MAFDISELPLDFGDAAAEVAACRTGCTFFDFSFLECAIVSGRQAGRAVGKFTGRSTENLKGGEIYYALRLGHEGEALSDLTVWRTGAETFEVMSGRREDVLDLMQFAGDGVEAKDISNERSVFSVQGPGALDALRGFGDVDSIERLKYFTFTRNSLANIPCTIGRLGYTGEAGFEIVVEHRHASDLEKALTSRIRRAGFVAADILRIEAGFFLFANEFRLPVSPIEAGLSKFCKSENVVKPEVRLVSFVAHADRLSWPWQPAGKLTRPKTPETIVVTSACLSVAAGGILGLGYVLADTTSEIVLRDPTGTFRDIRLTSLPFYDSTKKRPRAPWR